MSRFNKTGGSTGSNQYQVRGTAQRTSTAPVSHVDLMRQISPEITHTVADTPAAPPPDVDMVCDQFFEQVKQARESTAAFAKQIGASTDPVYLSGLTSHRALEVRVAALKNRHTPVEPLRSHYLAIVSDDSGLLMTNRHEYNAMLRHPDCPPEICMSIYHNSSGWGDDQTRAAAHPNCPPHMLEASNKTLWPHTVRSYHFSPDTLSTCTQSKTWEIRDAAAQNRYTPPAALASLVRDTSKNVRKSLAANPNTPIQEMLQLVRDKDKDVRDKALHNPGCPEHIRALGSLL